MRTWGLHSLAFTNEFAVPDEFGCVGVLGHLHALTRYARFLSTRATKSNKQALERPRSRVFKNVLFSSSQVGSQVRPKRRIHGRIHGGPQYLQFAAVEKLMLYVSALMGMKRPSEPLIDQ